MLGLIKTVIRAFDKGCAKEPVWQVIPAQYACHSNQGDPTVRLVRHLSNRELVELDPEGVFTK